MELFTLGSSQLCKFEWPILSQTPISEDNRFGTSAKLTDAFIYRLTHTIRNEQAVRAKWEVEWQSPEESRKANLFLHENLANKEIMRSAITRTEIRPIPTQWKHLMKRLREKKVFHSYIQISYRKC